MRIALIGAGDMGAGIGGRLVNRGATVWVCLKGRSDDTVRRAEKAGLTGVVDEAALLADAELVLSILPPGEAETTAARIAAQLLGRGGQVAYADCNAVSPATARRIGDIIEGMGAPFIDIGIVGGPPRGETDSPRLYASGSGVDRASPLGALGLDLRRLPGGAGEASALKMAYASVTKGFMAVGANLGSFDLHPEVRQALNAEFRASQPDLTAWLARQTPTLHPKAYRWVNEMEQIAATLGDAPGAEVYRAIARFYESVAADRAAGRTETAERTADLLKPT